MLRIFFLEILVVISWRESLQQAYTHHSWNLKYLGQDFPGGAVVKNPPANAGDAGLSLGLGRSHMPWSNLACAPQLLSLRSRAHEPQLLSPHATTTEADRKSVV